MSGPLENDCLICHMSDAPYDAAARADEEVGAERVFELAHLFCDGGLRDAQGRGGSIINIVSIEGVRAAPLYAAYAACKAAVINFTHTLNKAEEGNGVRVTALSPGFVPTPLTANMPAESVERVRVLCSVSDPLSGKYRLDYALFIEIFAGMTVLGAMAHYLVREWRRQRRPAPNRSIG